MIAASPPHLAINSLQEGQAYECHYSAIHLDCLFQSLLEQIRRHVLSAPMCGLCLQAYEHKLVEPLASSALLGHSLLGSHDV